MGGLPSGADAYNPGDNITGVTAGMRLGIYALNNNGRVIAFSSHVLSASEIAAFVPVTDITGVPTAATAGTDLTLTGTVEPGNATNQTMVWSIKNTGGTGATISGNTLSVPEVGTVTVTASIANGLAPGTDYAKDFNITVNPAFVPVTDITGVPTAATAGSDLTLTGTVEPGNATNQTMVWSIKNTGGTGAAISGNTLSVPEVGTVTVTASIANGLAPGTDYAKDFTIEVRVAAPSIEDKDVGPDGDIYINELSHTGAASFAIYVQDSAFIIPNVGDSLPALPAGHSYTSYTTGQGSIAITAGPYLGIYALDADGRIIAFSRWRMQEDGSLIEY